MEEKTYTFFTPFDENNGRFEKKESELTQGEKDLLFGELVHIWNNNTKENQQRFMAMLVDGIDKKSDKEMHITFEEITKLFNGE